MQKKKKQEQKNWGVESELQELKAINTLLRFKLVTKCLIQWAPLNVILDNVIIGLLLSDLLRPGRISNISTKQICLLWSFKMRIWLLLSVNKKNWLISVKKCQKSAKLSSIFNLIFWKIVVLDFKSKSNLANRRVENELQELLALNTLLRFKLVTKCLISSTIVMKYCIKKITQEDFLKNFWFIFGFNFNLQNVKTKCWNIK